ncbi:MAG: helix-turn-helix domain-containing protein [Actinobacteria bacterium]|nr:helix-turn-helix domain-containing protein [Actinomycetota bacterium]
MGSRIRVRRLELDLTQKELGEAVGDGVSKQTVRNWEAGRSEPTKHSADLAAALQWTEEELWAGPPPRRAQGPRRGPRRPTADERFTDAVGEGRSSTKDLLRQVRERTPDRPFLAYPEQPATRSEVDELRARLDKLEAWVREQDTTATAAVDDADDLTADA